MKLLFLLLIAFALCACSNNDQSEYIESLEAELQIANAALSEYENAESESDPAETTPVSPEFMDIYTVIDNEIRSYFNIDTHEIQINDTTVEGDLGIFIYHVDATPETGVDFLSTLCTSLSYFDFSKYDKVGISFFSDSFVSLFLKEHKKLYTNFTTEYLVLGDTQSAWEAAFSNNPYFCLSNSSQLCKYNTPYTSADVIEDDSLIDNFYTSDGFFIVDFDLGPKPTFANGYYTVASDILLHENSIKEVFNSFAIGNEFHSFLLCHFSNSTEVVYRSEFIITPTTSEIVYFPFDIVLESALNIVSGE